MSKIVVFNSVTLDGVMQAPGDQDEDRRDGFERGGWAVSYYDELIGKVAAEGMAQAGPLLLGRRTYEKFYSYWPHQTDGNPFTDVLNNSQKYVVSRTLTEPLPWQNSTLLTDATAGVRELRNRPGKDVTVLGSGELLQTLMRHKLVDRYVLLIHPIVVGSGHRLFTGEGTFATLRLVDSVTTTTGVIIATYEPIDASAPRE